MRFIIHLLSLILVLSGTTEVFAQSAGKSAWLNVDYTYNNLAYSQAQLNEKGNFAGVRGELGIALAGFLGVSMGGDYMDGNLNYDGAVLGGTPIQVVSKDYLRDTRAMVHMIYGGMIVSGGIAQREWYDNVPTAYRRRETYDYYPVTVTMYRESIYIKGEFDVWKAGKNKTYMSDVSASQTDVTFKQKKGSGYGLEIGYMVHTGSAFVTRLFASYHRWDVDDSDVQSDDVHSLTEPKSRTVTIQGGLGISF